MSMSQETFNHYWPMESFDESPSMVDFMTVDEFYRLHNAWLGQEIDDNEQEDEDMETFGSLG